MRNSRTNRVAQRDAYFGFRGSSSDKKNVESLASRSGRDMTDLLNEWLKDGAARFERELRHKEQQRFQPA